MAVRDDRGDEKQTTAGFRDPLRVQSLTSAKSKFLSLPNRGRFFSRRSFKGARASWVGIKNTFCKASKTHGGC